MDSETPLASSPEATKSRFARLRRRVHQRFSRLHVRIPYLRKLPLAAILIISLLVIINLVIWAICGIILAYHTELLSTAALAYSLGLRHALDADHISAIDLMTRRLIATGQRPVTVGTFFSLGHSTIVIVTSIVVAATAAGVADHFDGFGNVGGIIGTSVSAAFLILLGIMNAYILYKLIVQIRKVIRMQPEQAAEEAWRIEGGGVLFRVLKKMFKLIDRPWKMYPLGVLFGLGFDTSSEIALLGISSIQAARGTSIWLILIFPVLFTSGMCLVDTIDGALMMSLYVAPMGMGGDEDDKKENIQQSSLDINTVTISTQQVAMDDVDHSNSQDPSSTQPLPLSTTPADTQTGPQPMNKRIKDPLTFLYYSIVLTSLTVICAIVIGVLQLLSLILNTAHPTGPFWHGVELAGEYYEVIGGAICGSFIVFGGISVLCYRPWKRWVAGERARLRAHGELGLGENVGSGYRDDVEEDGADAGRGDRGGGGGGRGVVREQDGEGGVYIGRGRVEELTDVGGKGLPQNPKTQTQSQTQKSTTTIANKAFDSDRHAGSFPGPSTTGA